MGLKLSPFSIAILLSYEIKLFTSIAPDPRNEGIKYRDPGRITLKASSATGKSLQTPYSRDLISFFK